MGLRVIAHEWEPETPKAKLCLRDWGDFKARGRNGRNLKIKPRLLTSAASIWARYWGERRASTRKA